jgi:hypothetical protein
MEIWHVEYGTLAILCVGIVVSLMPWVGRPFRPDAYWWALTPERPNRQHYHLHRNKNHLLLERPLFPHLFLNKLSAPVSSRLAPSRPCRRARNAASCCTAPECHRLLSCVPTATHHSPPSSSSQHGMVHNNYSGAAFFTMPSRLPATILPLHCTADSTMCLFQVCFRSCFQVFHLYVAYVARAIYVCCKYMFQVFQLFHTYVSRVLSVCFMCFICMFHVFH